MNEVFTVVDATALISKFNLWEERDKSIKEGYDKLNNTNISKYSADKDAKIGAKATNKFWYGFKKHASVDTQSGMINKVAVTPAKYYRCRWYETCMSQKAAWLLLTRAMLVQ